MKERDRKQLVVFQPAVPIRIVLIWEDNGEFTVEDEEFLGIQAVMNDDPEKDEIVYRVLFWSEEYEGPAWLDRYEKGEPRDPFRRIAAPMTRSKEWWDAAIELAKKCLLLPKPPLNPAKKP